MLTKVVKFLVVILDSENMLTILTERENGSYRRFRKDINIWKLYGIHIRLRSDNTTIVACIDRCGSTKVSLLTIVDKFFEWANMRNITLSAEHIKGKVIHFSHLYIYC